MITTDLYINGGDWWAIGGILLVILAIAGAITWGATSHAYSKGERLAGRIVGITLLAFGILAAVMSFILAGAVNNDQVSHLVRDIHSHGYSDPITINEQTFTTGERWCALKPIGPGETPNVFKIVCEAEK